MPSVIEQTIDGVKDTTNEALNRDPWIPRYMGKEAGYITEVDERPQQLNEYDSYTKAGNRSRFKIILSITDDPKNLDLAPELSLKETAETAKKFINNLPDDY